MLISYALIGVELRISEDDFGSDRRADCQHRFKVNDSNFCPYCGIPVIIADTKYPADPTLDDFIARLERNLPEGYLIGRTLDGRVFVGLGKVASQHDPVTFMPWPISHYHEMTLQPTLQRLLDQYGLYDWTTFGFYNVVVRKKS